MRISSISHTSLGVTRNPVFKDNMLSERALKKKQRICPRPWGTLDCLPREILFHIMEMVLRGSVSIVPHDRVDVPHTFPSMAHILTRVNSVWFGWGVQFVWARVSMCCFTEPHAPASRLRAYSNYVTSLHGSEISVCPGLMEIPGSFEFPNIKTIECLRLNDREKACARTIAAKASNNIKKISIRLDYICDPPNAKERILEYISLFPGIASLSIGGPFLACPPKVLDGVLQLTSLTQLKLSLQWHGVESYRCLSQLSNLTRLDIYCLSSFWVVERRPFGTLRDALGIIKPLENLRSFLIRTLVRPAIEDVEAFFEGIVRDKPKLRELTVEFEDFGLFLPSDFGASLTQYNSPLLRLVIYSNTYYAFVEEALTRIFPNLQSLTVFEPEPFYAAEETGEFDWLL